VSPSPGTAADHLVRAVPTARANETVAEIRRGLVGRPFAYAGDVAVLDDEDHLVGMIALARLLASPGGETASSIMDADPPAVRPEADEERVAWRLAGHDEASIPVVDETGRFRGLVPPHRMLAVLTAEHDEDMARLGGYLASSRRARAAAEEPVARRLLHRLPWLVLGLLGAMVSTGLLAAFEAELDRKVLIAFFVPAVVYMADAVGTQTETLLIRGLAVGASLRRFAAREVATGLAIGVVIGAVFLAFAYVVWGDAALALAVALALVASASVATAIAMVLPWAFQRLGLDPAFGSGPLATVAQDLLSIVIYLVIATSIAG
jgi:magnesium transporter